MQQTYGMRWRVLITGIFMVFWLIFYSVLAVTLVGFIDAHPVVNGILYAVLGLAWIFPLMWLFKWAAKDDEARR